MKTSDLISTSIVLILVSLTSWRQLGNLSFTKYIIALVSLSGFVANDTRRVDTKISATAELLPGIMMSVTIPAALLHLHMLTLFSWSALSCVLFKAAFLMFVH